MFDVGANNFAKIYPTGKTNLQTTIWLPAFRQAMAKKPENLKVHFMGDAAIRQIIQASLASSLWTLSSSH
jgi:hypothetical protein